MKVARFGWGTWAGAYVFGDALMEDAWASARPAVVAQVGGAGGVFDFHGSTSSPPPPLVVRKRFALTADSSAAIEDALNTLRARTIVKSNSRTTDISALWFLDRDGSTKYWMWAKCTRLTASESYRERGRWMKVVDLEFFCREGLWYSETHQTLDSGVVTGSYGSSLTNAGNYPALVEVRVDVDATSPAAMTSCTLTNDDNSSEWTFSGTVAIGNTLEVDAGDYKVRNAGVASYSDLASGAGQVAWWWLDEIDADPFTFTPAPLTVKHRFQAFWYHTYIF